MGSLHQSNSTLLLLVGHCWLRPHYKMQACWGITWCFFLLNLICHFNAHSSSLEISFYSSSWFIFVLNNVMSSTWALHYSFLTLASFWKTISPISDPLSSPTALTCLLGEMTIYSNASGSCSCSLASISKAFKRLPLPSSPLHILHHMHAQEMRTPRGFVKCHVPDKGKTNQLHGRLHVC